jgi:hypothetical protein
MPPELAEALARFQRGARRQRGIRGRLAAMFVFALALAEALASRTYGVAVVFACVLLVAGLTFRRRGRGRDTRSAAPWPPPG